MSLESSWSAVVEFKKKQHIKKIGESMKRGFKTAKVDCNIVICKPSNGPKIVKVVK
jgi:homoserine kinase